RQRRPNYKSLAKDTNSLSSSSMKILIPFTSMHLAASSMAILSLACSSSARTDGGAGDARLDALGDVGSDGARALCPDGGQVRCGEACVDRRVDPMNCGACGNVCSAGQVCSTGECSAAGCTPGLTACGAACVDLQSDPAHCGGCPT